MPIYSTRCPACHARGTIFRRVADRDDLPGCDCGGKLERVIDKPFVRPEIAPYESPLFPGTWINSRAQRQEELTRNGKMEWEPGLKADILKKQQENVERACTIADRAIDQTVRDLAASGHLET